MKICCLIFTEELKSTWSISLNTDGGKMFNSSFSVYQTCFLQTTETSTVEECTHQLLHHHLLLQVVMEKVAPLLKPTMLQNRRPEFQSDLWVLFQGPFETFASELCGLKTRWFLRRVAAFVVTETCILRDRETERKSNLTNKMWLHKENDLGVCGNVLR